VQSAVDTTNHLIVAHEVTNVGTDRSQLASMAQAAKAALRSDNLDVVAETLVAVPRQRPVTSLFERLHQVKSVQIERRVMD
jgi:hypothetical protein